MVFRPPNSKLRILISRGFTLIELALVCATIGILVVALLPRFQETMHGKQAERSAFELTQLLRLGHERAVAEAREVLWTWDRGAHRARLSLVDADASGSAVPPASPPPPVGEDQRFVQSGLLPNELEVNVVRDNQGVECNCVHFFPDGESEPITLLLRFTKQQYTINVNAATSEITLTTGATAR